MMKRKVKAGSAIFLALAVAFSVFVLPGVWAADAIQVDRNDCSVEFSVGSDYKLIYTKLLLWINQELIPLSRISKGWMSVHWISMIRQVPQQNGQREQQAQHRR